MAILVRQDVPGVSAERFSALFVPLFQELSTHPGLVASACGPITGGYQVTEVWDSQEAHERWMREVVAPVMRRAGLAPLAPTQYLPLEWFLTPGAHAC